MAAHSNVQQVQSEADRSPVGLNVWSLKNKFKKRVELLALNTALTSSIVLLFLIMAGHSADKWKVHCDAQSGFHISSLIFKDLIKPGKWDMISHLKFITG